MPHQEPTSRRGRGPGASPKDIGYLTERRAILFFRRHGADRGWDISEHERFERRITPLLAPDYGIRPAQVPDGLCEPDLTVRRNGAVLLVADVVDKAFDAYGEFESDPLYPDDERRFIDHGGPLAPFARAVNAKALQAPVDEVPFMVIIGTSPRGPHAEVPYLNLHHLATGLEGGDVPIAGSAWLAPHSPVSAAALLTHAAGEQHLEVLINPRASVPLDPALLRFAGNVVETGIDHHRIDQALTRRWTRGQERGLRD